jgi:thiazole synthase ThiGH ThiG subunit
MTGNEMGLCSEVKMVSASLRIAVEMKAGIQGATSRKERGEWGNRAVAKATSIAKFDENPLMQLSRCSQTAAAKAGCLAVLCGTTKVVRSQSNSCPHSSQELRKSGLKYRRG